MSTILFCRPIFRFESFVLFPVQYFSNFFYIYIFYLLDNISGFKYPTSCIYPIQYVIHLTDFEVSVFPVIGPTDFQTIIFSTRTLLRFRMYKFYFRMRLKKTHCFLNCYQCSMTLAVELLNLNRIT